MKTILISLIAYVTITFAVSATTYFVSPSGNNTNAGANSAPFLTIDKGITSAGNYDTVIVLAGTYFINSKLIINKPITLLGQGAQIDGSSWSAATPSKSLLFISNTNDVMVDGFVFKNLIGDFSIGIEISGSGRNITIQHCLVTNIGWIANNLSAIPSGSNNANGILVIGRNTTPLSRINILFDTITNCALGFSEALTVVGNVDTFIVANNNLYANSNIGIDCAGSKTFTGAPSALNYARNGRVSSNIVFNCNSPIAASAGIYLDGAYNCIVDRNVVFDNAVGISLGQESPLSAGAKSCSRNKVVNNLILQNAISGIICGDNFGLSTKVINNIISNNTLFRNRTGAIINGVISIGGVPAGTGNSQYGNVFGAEILIQSSDSSTFENNIIFPLGIRHCIVVPDTYIATNLVVNYNSFNRDNPNVSYFDIGAGASANGILGALAFFSANVAGLYTNTIVGYPNFIDTNNLNFRLSTSPLSNCINAGNPASSINTISLTDFDGNPRIFGNRIDIGAYESQTSLSIENSRMDEKSFFNATIFPNPSSGFFKIKSSEYKPQFFIFDIAAHLLFQGILESDELDLSSLPSGTYQLKLVGRNGKTTTKRIIKL